MKKLHLIIFAIIALACNACEKVIDLDLKNAEPTIVIEANLTDDYIAQKVKITQTKAFTEDNTPMPIFNAIVTVKDLTLNKSYTFGTADAEGNYSSEIFKGIPGNTYELTVQNGNESYIATSTMPKKVLMDSLSVTEISFFGNTQKYVKVNYSDPSGDENQYRYLLKVNGLAVKGYFVDSDRFNNGKYISNTLFNDEPELKSGDEIQVEFQCVDKNIYRYFFAIAQISGNGGPPTAPANPDSNFNNGALGYFNAHTSETKMAVIK
ncbi:MAG TPA: DUF4249 family protein [Pelobium sp.]|nr:DUF4249 family protein [Pelobium sp.]